MSSVSKIKTNFRNKNFKHTQGVAFTANKALPGKTLYEGGVFLVPGLLDVSRHINNFLVNKINQWALVSRLVVKFNGEKLQDMIAFDIYKHFKDLVCKNMFLEGIQTENLSIIRLNAGDKKNFRH